MNNSDLPMRSTGRADLGSYFHMATGRLGRGEMLSYLCDTDEKVCLNKRNALV